MGWEAYFTIYPFTQDREDMRNALLASVIANVSGKALKQLVGPETFMPNYEGEPAPTTLEQKKAGWKAFKAKVKAVQRGNNVTQSS